ncbi:MAG: ABC transporter permease [Limnohabitans sp.]
MATPDTQRWNPVLALYVAVALGASMGLPFVRVAPNRLLSGDPIFLGDVLQRQGSPLVVALVLAVFTLLVFAIGQPQRRLTQALVSLAMAASLAGLWLLASHVSSSVSPVDRPLQRTALGAGFWTLAALAWLTALDAVARLNLATLPRLIVHIAGCLPLLLSLSEGQNLSLAKEYANHSDVVGPAVVRHLQIVLLAVVPAVVIGVPLAWRMSRSAVLRQGLFPLLNLIQTIPAIALFGLLMAPLAWLAVQLPLLGSAGIRGVGMAPAVLALFLYSLLPIVRAALAGLEQVPADTILAARAMGMSPWQIFWQIELPLELPVLLIGVRTALVQTIGLAAVCALIGAGGLGQIMFDGLFSAANELVILGVMPIVLLAMLADSFFQILETLFKTPAP